MHRASRRPGGIPLKCRNHRPPVCGAASDHSTDFLPMHMKRTLIIGTALAALLLSGCEALQEERQNFLDLSLIHI